MALGYVAGYAAACLMVVLTFPHALAYAAVPTSVAPKLWTTLLVGAGTLVPAALVPHIMTIRDLPNLMREVAADEVVLAGFSVNCGAWMMSVLKAMGR